MKPFMQETHWGYCNYFDERPFGSSLKQAVGVQVTGGAKALFALYQYDFCDADGPMAAELNERGRLQVARIAQRLRVAPSPVVVETSGRNFALDSYRTEQVRKMLAKHGAPVPEGLVVVRPIFNRLDGVEALEVYNNLMEQTSRGGGGMTSGGWVGISLGGGSDDDQQR
jgi:hypothetical protein